MPNLGALITNVELCSKADGRSTVTFPTLKKLSSSAAWLDLSPPCLPDVDAVWSIVSQYVRQKLLKAEPQAVRIPGLGTFHIKRWLSFENGEVHTFQKPVFALSRTAAEIRELQHAASCSSFPDKMKKVSVNYAKIQSKVLNAKDVVEETLKFFYFILRNREDTDFTLKGVGTLAIRGAEVTMAFCEDFLQSLNKSTYVVEKLLIRKWVTLDKEIPLLPSRFGRVHQFPQFEIRKVPRKVSVTNDEIIQDFERALSSMGVRGNVSD
ncbi:CCD81 protein, partial [Aegotheles bennettii]|nr:CCD81 protein [Aegotheles bennettii]